ncbi:hypothetical protein [Alistipes sp. ZOR0009]|uniref:hypothetical protein n=1 Tax=Alistipes sp. ZOR0009 TaxID=1339253 RepID=UPI0006478FC4|nr:hypothetical protein [Alistipes sp. ZOR0009]
MASGDTKSIDADAFSVVADAKRVDADTFLVDGDTKRVDIPKPTIAAVGLVGLLKIFHKPFFITREPTLFAKL